jgi:hypothetical protein
MTLPAHIRAAYPVHPTYATLYGENCGDFHLSNSLSDGLDDSMLSESTFHDFSKRIHRRQGKEYDEQGVQAYYSSTPGAQLEDYREEHSCSGSSYTPSGAKFRNLYEFAEHSKLTEYKLSNMERYTRQLQSVE